MLEPSFGALRTDNPTLTALTNWLCEAPELTLVLSLSAGYALGQLRVGSFRLGGLAGSLLAALMIAQLGVVTEGGYAATLLPLSMYALGWEAAPGLLRDRRVMTGRDLTLALFVACSALFATILTAELFDLNVGLAAALAAGVLMQPALVCTAADSLVHAAVTPPPLHSLEQSLAFGFALAYLAARSVHGYWRDAASPLPEPGLLLYAIDAAPDQRGALQLYRVDRQLRALASRAVERLRRAGQADFAYFSLGALLSVLLAVLARHAFGSSASWSPAISALIGGLLIGSLHASRVRVATLSPAACRLLKELGLAGCLASLGLRAGPYTSWSVPTEAALIVWLALGLSVVVLASSASFARHVLGYRDSRPIIQLLAHALPGAGEPLPGAAYTGGPLTPTPAASVAFALLGPLIVLLA